MKWQNVGITIGLVISGACIVVLTAFNAPNDTRPSEVPAEFRVPNNQRFLLYSNPPGAEVWQENPQEAGGTRVSASLTNENPFEIRDFRLGADGQTVEFRLKKPGYQDRVFRTDKASLQSGLWPPLSESIATLEPSSWWFGAQKRHPFALAIFPFGLLLAALSWRYKEKEHRRLSQVAEELVAADGDPFYGKLVNEYRVRDFLGKGAYGRVYRAVVEGSQRKTDYAIKIIDYSAIKDDALHRARFDREMELIKSFDHPNIGRIIDFGRTEGYDWVLMPLYDGRTLEHLRIENDLSYEDILNFAKDIANGLTACHDLGIFHRDLKPENIMLDGDTAIIIDFGMARGQDQRTLTMEGHMVGSPSYMAPEISRSTRVDGRADQYAYGMILFYLLTSSLPFSTAAVDAMSVLTEKLFGRLFLLREVDPSQHEAVEVVLAKMIERNLEDRYPNLSEAYEDFEKAVKAAINDGSNPEGLARDFKPKLPF